MRPCLIFISRHKDKVSSAELTGYESEPRERFEELPADQAHLLYHYERMTHDLSAESRYYHSRLRGRCRRLLELGCGTGILSSTLQHLGYEVTGIDLDRGALRVASGTAHSGLVQMDMGALGFKPVFEAVLIGQNTLNLLADRKKIGQCLEQIRSVLVAPGLLFAHLYCTEPGRRLRDGERLMQFYVFDHPEGGKILKETIRSCDPHNHLLNLEQRHKLRHFSAELPDHNYRSFITLAAFSRDEWKELIASAGFSLESLSSGFRGGLDESSQTLHLVARKKTPC